MKPEIQFFLGAMGLTAVVTYAWWVRFRVWMLRQDLFAIRDELWDEMRAAGDLDDPDHRETRELLNALIRVAPLISIFTFMRIALENDLKPEGDIAQRPDAVEVARRRMAVRICRYLLFQTASGWLVTAIAYLGCLVILVPLKALQAKLSGVIERILGSGELLSLGPIVSGGKPGSMSHI